MTEVPELSKELTLKIFEPKREKIWKYVEDPVLSLVRDIGEGVAQSDVIIIGHNTDLDTLLPPLQRICNDKVRAWKIEPKTYGHEEIIGGLTTTEDITETMTGFYISDDEGTGKMSMYLRGKKVPQDLPKGAYIAIAPGGRPDVRTVTRFLDAYAGEGYLLRRPVYKTRTLQFLERVTKRIADRSIDKLPELFRVHPVVLQEGDLPNVPLLFKKYQGNTSIYLDGFTKTLRGDGMKMANASGNGPMP
jgi:hypothetical protein